MPGGARVLTHRGGRSVPQAPSGTPRRWSGRPADHRYAPPSVRNPFASPLWRNRAFVRVWAAATISIFGSLITRIALPLVAILVARRRARSRSPSCAAWTSVATLVVRPRRRRLGRPPAPTAGPDLGRPRPGGRCSARSRSRSRSASLTFRQLLVVVGAGGRPDHVLRRRRQRLPADDRRARAAGRREQRPGGERLGGRVHGLRHQRLPGPAADRRRSPSPIDAVTYLVSAAAARRRSGARSATATDAEDREPVLDRDPRRAPARPSRPDPARVRRRPDVAGRRCGASSARRGSCSSLDELELEPGRARASSPGSVASRRSSARSSRRARRRAGASARSRSAAMLLVGRRQRVHPAGAGRPAARRGRLPGHASSSSPIRR